jgi:uncharacterized protein YndB with AHSA1/START domain
LNDATPHTTFRIAGRQRNNVVACLGETVGEKTVGETVIVGGVYRVIVPPAKIVFSWVVEPPDEQAGIESEVTVTPDGTGAELLIRH